MSAAMQLSYYSVEDFSIQNCIYYLPIIPVHLGIQITLDLWISGPTSGPRCLAASYKLLLAVGQLNRES
jgi:hypothetical protein